jgi:hypothetical protein
MSDVRCESSRREEEKYWQTNRRKKKTIGDQIESNYFIPCPNVLHLVVSRQASIDALFA